MRESVFNAEIVNSLNHWGAWCYKIQDIPVSQTFGLRYTPDKPCDILAAYRGKFIAIESKQIKKFEAFGMRHMRPAQIKHLNAIVNGGSRAFVFLNVRIPAIKKVQKRENRLIIFDWKSFRDRGERSIKKDEIAKLPYIVSETVNKRILYNLSFFLAGL